jgi:hypothetical protein
MFYEDDDDDKRRFLFYFIIFQLDINIFRKRGRKKNLESNG